jgi:hypothetical protein
VSGLCGKFHVPGSNTSASSTPRLMLQLSSLGLRVFYNFFPSSFFWSLFHPLHCLHHSPSLLCSLGWGCIRSIL